MVNHLITGQNQLGNTFKLWHIPSCYLCAMLRILVLFHLFPVVALGQEILWSTPQKITNSTYYTNILGQNPDGVFYFQTSKNERDRHILVTALRHDMKLRVRKEFLNGKDEYLEKIVLLNSKLTMLYTIRNRKDGISQLFAKSLDMDLNEMVDDKPILTTTGDAARLDLLSVYPGRERNSMLLVLAANNDSLHNNLTLIVLDENGQETHRHKLSIGLDLPFTLSRQVFVDNRFIAVLNFERKDGLLKKEPVKILVEKDLNTGQMRLHELWGPDFNTTYGLMNYDNQTNALQFTAFYYAQDSTYPQGFYQYQVYTEKDSAKQRLLAFNPLFMNELFGKARSTNDLRSLYLMKAIKRSDGGDILICERKEIDEQHLDDISVYGVQHTYTRYYYYYYEISILSLSPDNSLEWHKMIKKEQISLNDDGYYSSFGCQVTRDRLYFVYNDLTRKSSNVMLYEVNPYGQGEGNIFLKSAELDGYAIPKESIQVSDNEFLLPVVKLREGFSLVKIRQAK